MPHESVSRVQITKQGHHKGWTRTKAYPTHRKFLPNKSIVSVVWIIFSSALFVIQPLPNLNISSSFTSKSNIKTGRRFNH